MTQTLSGFRWMAFAAGALGCMSDLTIPFENEDCGAYLGSFSGSATGAKDGALSGCAYFAVDSVTQELAFVLTNGRPNATDPMLRLFRLPFPGPNPNDPFAPVTVAVGNGGGQLHGAMLLGSKVFTLTSGSLTRTIGNDDYVYDHYQLNGTLDLTGQAADGATLRVIGEFTGRCVDLRRADPGVDDNLVAPESNCRRADALLRVP